jgi:hypothetical protein
MQIPRVILSKAKNPRISYLLLPVLPPHPTNLVSF